MRAMLFSVLLALPVAEAAAADVSVGVALAGNLTIGQSSSSEIAERQGPTLGGGGLRVPVRLAASELATFRVIPRFDYYQLDQTVAVGDPTWADSAPCPDVGDYPAQRLPASGAMGGATIGGEVTLLKRETVRLYATGDAGIGYGKTWIRWFYFEDTSTNGTCFQRQVNIASYDDTQPQQQLAGLFGVGEIGLGVGIGPLRAELGYGRVALPSGKIWANSNSTAPVTPEALSTFQLTVGVAFGG